MNEKSNKSTISIKCSDYEDSASSVFIYANNGFWAGGLTFYIENENFEHFFDELLKYEGTNESKVKLECGEPDDKWAYYINLEVKPRDGAGQTDVKIHIVDNSGLNEGKSVELIINCTPSQANELGRLIKKSYLQRTTEIWEVLHSQ